MQNKIIFREMLSEIKKLADQKGNRLTREEVRDFFAKAGLNQEQLELIYDYLAGQKIEVEGRSTGRKGKIQGSETEDGAEKMSVGKAAEETAEGDEEPGIDFLGMYLADLDKIDEVSKEERQLLFDQAAAGSSAAKNRLAQQYLKIVYELSMTYVGGQLPKEDLIQEGNVGLLLALDTLERREGLEDYENYIFRAVQEAMEEAIELSQDTRDMDEEIAGRVNHLNEAILNLQEDLGHKVSMEELSVYLEMPLEEIRDILRMAGDEMKEKQ